MASCDGCCERSTGRARRGSKLLLVSEGAGFFLLCCLFFFRLRLLAAAPLPPLLDPLPWVVG
jgi:hypothetical protein